MTDASKSVGKFKKLGKKVSNHLSLRLKRRKRPIYKQGKNVNTTFKPGISVITPSYHGEKHIHKFLESIKNQTIPDDLFEVIIVINGEKGETPNIIENFRSGNPSLDIKVHFSDIKSVSNARNIGIENAARSYITFIDDDDHVSANFLEELYRHARLDRIVISQINEVGADSTPIPSLINEQILKHQGTSYIYGRLSRVLTINACKLIPSFILKQVRYDVNLKSGEDIVFFTRLLTLCDFELYVVAGKQNAIYYRVVRPEFLSRKTVNYNFNVKERLEVIRELNKILLSVDDEENKRFIRQKVDAQTSLINQYLQLHGKEIQRVREAIKEIKPTYFPYHVLNKGLAKDLVISYCFPPYVDTSGNNMAKRVREWGEVVDVVHNDMGGMRKVDYSLNLIADEFIENKVLVDAGPTFGDWKKIHKFSQRGMKKISQIVQEKGSYDTVYSRSMFPASNFLAYEYKIRYPETRWIAEISDPLLYDIKSKVREVKIRDPSYLEKINHHLKKWNAPEYHGNNLFFLSEYLPYIFADEVIFTNNNQKQYMLENFPVKEVREIVEAKSRIKPHPILPNEFYHKFESHYPLDTDLVNFAYFGSFYETRNLDDVYHALEHLEAHQDKYKLHIFTSNLKETKKTVKELPIQDNVVVNPFVSFLEFLNLTTKFDCLIVNDALTKPHKDINPYLPSKLSDYMGSTTDIWTICEEGSAMSTCEVKYKSFLGDKSGATGVAQRIILDHLNI